MSNDALPQSGVRLAELIAALSLTADLGMGQPMEFGLRSCLLAVHLGDAMGMDEGELAEVYYVALLRLIGCTADAHVAAGVLGNEVAAWGWLTGVDWAQPSELMAALAQHFGAVHPPARRDRMVAGVLAEMPQLAGLAAAHCEVAQRLAERMGFGANVEMLWARCSSAGTAGALPVGCAVRRWRARSGWCGSLKTPRCCTAGAV